MPREAYSRHSCSLGWLHPTTSASRLLRLHTLLLQGLSLLLLLLQLLLAHLLSLVAVGSPLNHLHGIQVAVGGLAVYGLLDQGL